MFNNDLLLQCRESKNSTRSWCRRPRYLLFLIFSPPFPCIFTCDDATFVIVRESRLRLTRQRSARCSVGLCTACVRSRSRFSFEHRVAVLRGYSGCIIPTAHSQTSYDVFVSTRSHHSTHTDIQIYRRKKGEERRKEQHNRI